MKLNLNPFAIITKLDEEYQFWGCRSGKIIKRTLEKEQVTLLEKLKNEKNVEDTLLYEYFSEEFVKELMECAILVGEEVDAQSIYSRVYAFYRSYGMEHVIETLKRKKVLILGCGGIGTHMAWHMSVMGIGEITVVDFDKVEESNLNRQLLFDQEDIGREKVVVLSEKIRKINPQVKVNTIQTKIVSQEDIEKICEEKKYDLIVKALDSPQLFPKWLDEVCKKKKIPYVTGITMREQALIGPSFIPNQSEVGWSDLMHVTDVVKKEFGISASLGMILYHISDELALESFKILTGVGELKYTGKIYMKNVFTNKEEVIEKESYKKEMKYLNSKKHFKVQIGFDYMLVSILAFMSMLSPYNSIIAGIVAMALPIYLCQQKREILKLTVINAILYSLILYLMLIRNGVLILGIPDFIVFIALAVLGLGMISITIVSMCGINHMICRHYDIK